MSFKEAMISKLLSVYVGRRGVYTPINALQIQLQEITSEKDDNMPYREVLLSESYKHVNVLKWYLTFNASMNDSVAAELLQNE